jgi:DNA-directed RNA polymerase subunit RPC12/RpoP
MSVFNPRVAIRRHAEVPAVCEACGHRTALKNRDKEMDDALVDSTVLDDSRAELALLHRAERLFARFPDSNDALKVGREQLHPKQHPRVSQDLEFQAALQADPELSDFLRHSMFHLSTRSAGVTRLIEQLSQRDFSAIRCPNCDQGRLHLPEEFYHAL